MDKEQGNVILKKCRKKQGERDEGGIGFPNYQALAIDLDPLSFGVINASGQAFRRP